MLRRRERCDTDTNGDDYGVREMSVEKSILPHSHNLRDAGLIADDSIVHRGILTVASALLAQIMSLPEGSKILGAKMSDDGRDVELIVEHESIPGIRYGYAMWNITVEYTSVIRHEITSAKFKS